MQIRIILIITSTRTCYTEKKKNPCMGLLLIRSFLSLHFHEQCVFKRSVRGLIMRFVFLQGQNCDIGRDLCVGK